LHTVRTGGRGKDKVQITEGLPITRAFEKKKRRKLANCIEEGAICGRDLNKRKDPRLWYPEKKTKDHVKIQ